MMVYTRVCDLCGARAAVETDADFPEGWVTFEYGPERKQGDMCINCRTFLDKGVTIYDGIARRKIAEKRALEERIKNFNAPFFEPKEGEE